MPKIDLRGTKCIFKHFILPLRLILGKIAEKLKGAQVCMQTVTKPQILSLPNVFRLKK